MSTIAEQLLNLYEIKRGLAEKLNSYGLNVSVDSSFESFIGAIDSVITSPPGSAEEDKDNVKSYLDRTIETVRSSKISEIKSDTFRDFSSLYTVDLPNVTLVGGYAFYGCKRLRNVTLGQITSLGSGAFNNCTNMRKIWIPKSCETMICANYAGTDNLMFYNCTGLTVYTEFTSKPLGWASNWNKTRDSNSTPSVSVKWGSTYEQYLSA